MIVFKKENLTFHYFFDQKHIQKRSEKISIIIHHGILMSKQNS